MQNKIISYKMLSVPIDRSFIVRGALLPVNSLRSLSKLRGAFPSPPDNPI